MTRLAAAGADLALAVENKDFKMGVAEGMGSMQARHQVLDVRSFARPFGSAETLAQAGAAVDRFKGLDEPKPCVFGTVERFGMREMEPCGRWGGTPKRHNNRHKMIFLCLNSM
jgi:hypothetical protein